MENHNKYLKNEANSLIREQNKDFIKDKYVLLSELEELIKPY